VTRLDKFSPNGQLFTLGASMKITILDQILGLLVFHGERYVLFFLQKMGWATFLGHFSQTHLVTLSPANNFRRFKSKVRKNTENEQHCVQTVNWRLINSK
jgi:hypothetical protein